MIEVPIPKSTTPPAVREVQVVGVEAPKPKPAKSGAKSPSAAQKKKES